MEIIGIISGLTLVILLVKTGQKLYINYDREEDVAKDIEQVKKDLEL